jgi:hypothetical protein
MKNLIVAIALAFTCVFCGQAYAGSPVILKPVSSAHKVNKASKPKVAKKAVHTNPSSEVSV